MQTYLRFCVGILVVVAWVSVASRASAHDAAIAVTERPPLLSTTPAPSMTAGTDQATPSPAPEIPGDGQPGGGNPENPGSLVRPEPPPASEVGTLLKTFNDQRRWQRQELAVKTRSALSATRTMDRSERNRARAEVLAQAGEERESLVAAQREARTALVIQLTDLKSQRREHQVLVEAAKERGLEGAHGRHGAGRD